MRSPSQQSGARPRQSTTAFPSPLLRRKGRRGLSLTRRRAPEQVYHLQEVLESLEQRRQLLLWYVHAAQAEHCGELRLVGRRRHSWSSRAMDGFSTLGRRRQTPYASTTILPHTA